MGGILRPLPRKDILRGCLRSHPGQDTTGITDAKKAPRTTLIASILETGGALCSLATLREDPVLEKGLGKLILHFKSTSFQQEYLLARDAIFTGTRDFVSTSSTSITVPSSV